jgi:hypothetical protein
MRQPDGFGDGTNRVCWLQKTLYGLKQSGHEWNKELDRQLKSKGFNNIRSDPCAYIRRDGDNLEIVTVWVDDLLLFATSNRVMRHLMDDLKSIFNVTNLGEPSKIVGIEISCRNDSLTISQPLYINSILRKYGMENANPVSTPLDPNVRLEPNTEQREESRTNEYASLIGSLHYLTIATRPDIAYAVNRLASYTANPSLQITLDLSDPPTQTFSTDSQTLPSQMPMIESPYPDMPSFPTAARSPGCRRNNRRSPYRQRRQSTSRYPRQRARRYASVIYMVSWDSFKRNQSSC